MQRPSSVATSPPVRPFQQAPRNKVPKEESGLRTNLGPRSTALPSSIYLAGGKLNAAPRQTVQTPPFQNTLLRMMDADALKRLQLTPIRFELLHEIEFPGKRIDHLYFVEAGMASMTTTFRDGSQVEVGMFGCESVIGVSALIGTKRSLNRVYTQIAGHGYGCSVATAKKEFALGGSFHSLALRYVQAQLVQALQSVGCNARHTVDQRLARWLLLCADRVGTDRFPISHIFLADMLGSTRPTVTLAAGLLKDAKLIAYTRGLVQILDTPGLEARACECYQIIKDHLDNYAEFDTGKIA